MAFDVAEEAKGSAEHEIFASWVDLKRSSLLSIV